MSGDSAAMAPAFAGRLANFVYKDDEDQKPKTSLSTRVLRSRKTHLSTKEEGAGAEVAPAKRKAGEEEGDDEDDVKWTLITSPRKRLAKKRSQNKKGTSYAPPSTYAHLPQELPNRLCPHPIVLFVGLNPGLQTVRDGHAYAHPSNLFWKLLYSSGVTPVACRPEDDQDLPRRFRLGLTNIVGRPSRSQAELRPSELDDGVAALEQKVRHWRPEAVCLVGKGIWESIVRVRQRQNGEKKTNKMKNFHYGWQDESENMGRLSNSGDDDDDDDVAEGVRKDPDWDGAPVFVASSTSGLAASLSPTEKEAIWKELGSWVEKRRNQLKEEGLWEGED